MSFRKRVGFGTALRDAQARSAGHAYDYNCAQLEKRAESEPAAAALAQLYLSEAHVEKGRPHRLGGFSGDITKAIEEAMRLANPNISQTEIDHHTDRALSLATWPDMRFDRAE